MNIRFEDHLRDLQKTYDLLMESLHDMCEKMQDLKRENERLKEQVEKLQGDSKNETTLER